MILLLYSQFAQKILLNNYNIEIDQPINDLSKQYNEVRKILTEQGDDYTTGCLLDFAYFKNNYKLIAADLSKQKVLMQIQEQFSKLFLSVKQVRQQ